MADPNHSLLLAKAASHSNKAVLQWLEAALQVHDKQKVAQLLSENPAIIEDFHGEYGHETTALHLAARFGDALIAAQLLAKNPRLAHAVDEYWWTPLHWAATRGDDKVIAVLLEKTPRLIHELGNVPLYFAVQNGHDNVVSQLLAVNPAMATIVDSDGWTSLHYAARGGRVHIVEMLLAAGPDMVHNVTENGHTVLHLACESRSDDKQFYQKLLELNPAALRAINSNSQIPFDVAVERDNNCAIELMLWILTFEELAFSARNSNNTSFAERLRHLVETQCECLVGLLNRDVVLNVFEYLGFDPVKRLPRKKEESAK